ncbi:hypothetical protein [Amycolatopsis sp. SID8362]|uniref:hypothetical protein n=1 Tax=Amycolatopsis sp. SID8362 TaxID=2690346 RepID=UPI00136FBA12|nr:hypothetical protein [Amycolatopsis sp. SID8362]NBH12551.1 hypothetical protein [Amycolatopsis sp. SID8362]NED49243.1 hypothetical protein [Amycolatopsis sp. SID8362]
MVDDLVSGEGSGVILPSEGDESGPDGLVFQFPVEIEVRVVAPYDPDQLVTTALDRLTAALQGLT